MSVPIGTIRESTMGRTYKTEWLKVSDEPGEPQWEYIPRRIPATTMIRDLGWGVGTMLESERWPQRRCIRRIEGERVWMSQADADGKLRRAFRPVKTLPMDTQEATQ